VTHPSEPVAEPAREADVVRADRTPRNFMHYLAVVLLRLGGWRVGRRPPPRELAKYIIIAAPHTDWWDGFWMLVFSSYWGLKISWMGKAALGRGPFGWLALRLGLVPVDRSAPQGLVGVVVEEFARRDRMVLSIPPEGTRNKRDYWKSGFYRIAQAADVPLVLVYLDYGRGIAGFGPCFRLTGDVVKDMAVMREFYREVAAKYPEKFTTPRLREEDE
jgi:1-acyl-sn-glycerol-3-phosphate acyltransferase